jgi:D-ribulokinase
MSRYVVGVDVGTGSVRAALFDLRGSLLETAKQDIHTYSEHGIRFEQSSEEIWKAVCKAVRTVISDTNIDKTEVIGIGFDATCSLVVVTEDGQPLPVGEHGIGERNIIVWMDHRATDQAERINETGHAVLDYVGGRISPEMETPKLLWLRENLSTIFDSAGHFFDLTDYLTWRATGSLARSICTTVCKWTYLAHEQRWDESYFRQIGLSELADEGFARIGQEIVEPGTALSQGLTAKSAAELGLSVGTAVPAGLIDAHAGGIATVGALRDDNVSNPEACLAYVFGTSACTMTTTAAPVNVPGVWGPYYSAMIPGLWLNEAGQSAAGAGMSHLVTFHPAYAEAKCLAQEQAMNIMSWLAEQANSKCATSSATVFLAEGVHVVPEFMGNRAPFADPNARALIAGLDMDDSLDSLLALYVAGVCGLGYGLRQIIEAQASQGIKIDTIVISGGAGQDELVRQLIADSTQLEVVAPETSEPVILGASMLAAVAAGAYGSIELAMKFMSTFGARYEPGEGRVREIHQKRYKAFELLQNAGREIQ